MEYEYEQSQQFLGEAANDYELEEITMTNNRILE
jgi:hypothetical protein